MATVDSLSLVQELLRNNGNYPGDPQALAIYSYTNREGNRAFSICYTRSCEHSLVTSTYVRRPMQLWTKEEGLTVQGQRVLEETRADS